MAHLVKIAQSMQHFEVTAEVAISRDSTDDKFIALPLMPEPASSSPAIQT